MKNMRLVLMAVLAAALSLTPTIGTQASPRIRHATSGIVGKVYAVAVRPPHRHGARQATVAIRGAQVVAKRIPVVVAGRTTTSRKGGFTLRLAPGSYRLIVHSDRSNRPCQVPKPVRVRARHFTVVRIYCNAKLG